FYLPGWYRVHVIAAGSATGIIELFQCRLCISGFIGYPTHYFGISAIPIPQIPEPNMSFIQNGFIKCGQMPAFTGIGTYLYPGHLTSSRPGNSAYFYPAFFYVLRI